MEKKPEEKLTGNLETLRHSTSHILAQAVKRLFPQAKLGIGPAIKNGFYYDFDIEGELLSKNLSRISRRIFSSRKKW